MTRRPLKDRTPSDIVKSLLMWKYERRAEGISLVEIGKPCSTMSISCCRSGQAVVDSWTLFQVVMAAMRELQVVSSNSSSISG